MRGNISLTEPLAPGSAPATLSDAATRAIAAARRAIRAEAEGLARLEAAIDERFARAVELFAAIEGRIVVTGMGKSGHVARKIAATLA
ncbi:MAG: KpsF/GutQ family sugar-phosphate isomerase, partial [Geminicoccaceae bacterium]|nr:KpsF/GutQ family sugar-phosphate isomerase [Geminicoccaceae bacterium]